MGQDAALAVGLATEITPELRRDALAREMIHAVQGARRTAGLRVEERIRLHLDGSGLIREAIDEHRAAIAAETLATALAVGHGAPFGGLLHEEHVLDGEPSRAAPRPRLLAVQRPQEVDQQLVDPVGSLLLHPVAHAGQALDA